MSVLVNCNLEGLARIKYIRKCFLLYMHTHKYINILLHTCQQAMCIFTHTNTQILFTHAHAHTQTHTHTQTQILFTHVCDCAHTHIRTCVLVRERERWGRKCVYIYSPLN